MLLNINIFPLIRERDKRRGPSPLLKEIFHLVPSITRFPLDCRETVTERSSLSERSTNREDRAVSRTRRRVLSRCIGESESHFIRRTIVFLVDRIKTVFTERYANACPIPHAIYAATQTLMIPDVYLCATRANFFAKTIVNSASRKSMRIRDFTFITGWLNAKCYWKLEIFVSRNKNVEKSLR